MDTISSSPLLETKRLPRDRYQQHSASLSQTLGLEVTFLPYHDLYENHFPFWKTLSQEDKDVLSHQSSLVHFEGGQAIHKATDCSGLYIVQTGRLRLYILSESGKEITLYRLSPGDVCMLSASCVLQAITFDVYLEAEEPSDCIMVDGKAFSTISERVADVKIFALESALQRFSDVMWVMQQVVFMSMDERLAIFLLDDIANKEDDRVEMTHEQIARHLGTAREVVTRMLKRFAAEGWVEVTRGGIHILDKNKLRDLVS